jgi:two-component system, chemotaxis family, sensor kinase CheA
MTDYRDQSGRAAADFLAEAEEILEQLSSDLLALGDSADKDEYDPETVNSIFRSAHSLKGLAGMFGFDAIAELAHNLESLLDCIRLGKISLGKQTLAVLFDAIEVLGSLVCTVTAGSDGHRAIGPVLTRIAGCIASARADRSTLSPADLGLSDKVLQALTEYEEHRLNENIAKGKFLYLIHASYSLDTFDRELGILVEQLKEHAEIISTLPSADEDVPQRIAFDILIGSGSPWSDHPGFQGMTDVVVEPVRGASAAQEITGNGQIEPLPARPEALASGAGDGSTISARSVSRTLRVDIAKLDELMNIVGELLLFHGSVCGVAETMRNEGFSGLAVELGKTAKGMERKLNELQKRVLEVRMVPVGQLFEKLSRIVRRISREQGKKITLRVSGTDTELDKMIVEDIADPLMHIIRNAIDHGIELPEERLALGKEESGTIRLSSNQQGNHVVIAVADDGRGIDPEKIAKKALELGLIASDEGLSSQEILELIFLPGFSTADQVSDVSGRGVGMDVVANNIAAVAGAVEFASNPGFGSTVTITLPITLAIIKALLVNVSGHSYAIPVTAIRETISLEQTPVFTVERKEVIQLRDTTLPLLRLDQFFMAAPKDTPTLAAFAVIVGEADKRLGIVVDDLIGQQDIIIKPLGETFRAVSGIAGAADLGDQRTILVLDVAGIVSEATRCGG